MAHQPDGMGADRYHERQNMKKAHRQPPEPTHDVVAVDGSGEELFVTESVHSAEQARRVAEDLNNPRYKELDTIPPEVDHYEVRER